MDLPRDEGWDEVAAAVGHLLWRGRVTGDAFDLRLSEPLRDFLRRTIDGDDRDAWWRAVHPDDGEPLRAQLAEAAAGGPLSEVEVRLVTVDGELRRVRSRMLGRLDEDGSLVLHGALLHLTT